MRAWRSGWILGALCVTAGGVQAAWPTFDEVRASSLSSELIVQDRHGEPLQTVRVDDRARRLAWVRLQDISPALQTAIVVSEDQRFWAHSGVDWRSVAGSAWANLWNDRTRGASTVTMQLAGLLDADHARPSGGRSVIGKLGQAWQARQLDARWRKSDILEAYLNLVPWRGELVGINALSQTLFGKHPSALDRREAAIAAALVRGPNATAGQVARRACQVWQAMSGPPQACPGLTLLTEGAMQRRGGMPLGEQLAPHAARQIVSQARQAGWGSRQHPWPATWRSTLDARIQRLAVSLLRQQLRELHDRAVEDGAVIVLDNASGEVLAWVGSAGTLASARDVDAVLARRQAGSTLKPFIYELAFERRLLTPASLLDDSPMQWSTESGVYRPQNYDHRFKGWVSARQALGSSLNVPAVRVGTMLGAEALAQRFNALGLDLREPGGFYGPGLALGSAEVTLRDLSNAYRTLARGGWWSPVQWRREGSDAPQAGAARRPVGHRALSADATFLVTDILADNNARASTFGLDSVLATRGFAAVKTGTSKDMRDNWCIGFTDRWTVGVWVGNASGAPMHQVSGVSGAAPIWARLVEALHRDQPSQAPQAPPGVQAHRIAFQGSAGLEPARQEWFIAGTQQALWQVQASPSRRAISNPQDGALYALDPDMPPRVQRIVFTHDGAAPGRDWWLDGRRLSSSDHHGWLPWPGRHRLELRQGRELVDTVQFEVRGAGVKAPAAPPKAVQRRRVEDLRVAAAGADR